MTPDAFRVAAQKIAGPHWRTDLGPIIGRSRTQVWEYANAKRAIPVPVAKLVELLAEQSTKGIA